jgi:hypothetical protein
MQPAHKWAIDAAIHKHSLHTKSEIKPGTAPPSEVEKKIQQQVDQLRADLGLQNKKRMLHIL